MSCDYDYNDYNMKCSTYSANANPFDRIPQKNRPALKLYNFEIDLPNSVIELMMHDAVFLEGQEVVNSDLGWSKHWWDEDVIREEFKNELSPNATPEEKVEYFLKSQTTAE